MEKEVGEVGTVEAGSSRERERERERERGRKEEGKDGVMQQQAGDAGGKREREKEMGRAGRAEGEWKHGERDRRNRGEERGRGRWV